MSRHEGAGQYIDTMSSGDCAPRPKEENNNDVDELSKELSDMGCIVDAVKRPPNVCVETCAYESESEPESEASRAAGAADEPEDAYSDEFEDEEDESLAARPAPRAPEGRPAQPSRPSPKLSKSQSSVTSDRPPASMSGRSGRSTDYGPAPAPARRANMSFSNDRLREIERHNRILLGKILSARNSRKSSIPGREPPPRRAPPSAAVSRKSHQRQIDHDNMILLKKIQRAKSSAYSVRR